MLKRQNHQDTLIGNYIGIPYAVGKSLGITYQYKKIIIRKE